MKSLYISTLVLIICIISACSRDVDFVPYQDQIVVEGRIENDQYASILLSTSVSFTESLDTSNLLNHAIRNAKVTISDGAKSEILLLKTNQNKIPPYEYVTRNMKGEIGKHYYLTISYYDKMITAKTQIPSPVEIDELSFVKKQATDRTGYIHIKFENTSDLYYQIATQLVGEENGFTPCLYGNIDNTSYPKNEQISMQINKGPITFPKPSYTTYFPDSIPIRVKLSTQTKESYDFWISYQNEILNSQNPFFPSTNRLKSNINGGIGIWAGYGSTTKIIEPNTIRFNENVLEVETYK